ncbi:MAG TPA: peptidylprolyl isomerase [Isosphaeraceae bacterium]|nr:peptidylprolyl isomerase [Isosphaeraceae bacterium]
MTQGRTLLLTALAGLMLATVDPITARADVEQNPTVVIETSKGNITVELDREKAPITVENFLKYVDSGFYNGTIFHRVIPDFMIQGGGLTPNMQEKKTNPEIKNESGNGLSNQRGTIAMARKQDPNSASSQFFINVVDNKPLDTYGGGYTVFGKVTDGMDVVDAIRVVRTTSRAGMQDVPVEPVLIKSIKRQK